MSKAIYYTSEEVMARYSASLSTIKRWVKEGVLPAPVRLGRRAIRWRLADLEAFDAAREPVTVEGQPC